MPSNISPNKPCEEHISPNKPCEENICTQLQGTPQSDDDDGDEDEEDVEDDDDDDDDGGGDGGCARSCSRRGLGPPRMAIRASTARCTRWRSSPRHALKQAATHSQGLRSWMSKKAIILNLFRHVKKTFHQTSHAKKTFHQTSHAKKTFQMLSTFIRTLALYRVQ